MQYHPEAPPPVGPRTPIRKGQPASVAMCQHLNRKGKRQLVMRAEDTPKILPPAVEKPDHPNETHGASKQVVFTPHDIHDIPRILRVGKYIKDNQNIST